MASPWGGGLWGTLGQASNVAQLVGVDALGLVSMVVQAALAARRHRDTCRRLAQHVELVGALLRELEIEEMMRREATRRPLEQLRGALRRCYELAAACQDCGYLRGLLLGATMADELRAAQHEIDMFIRLIPLIALVDTTSNRRAKQATQVMPTAKLHTRYPGGVLEFTETCVQGANKSCQIGGKPLEVTVDLQEQKIMDMEGLVKLCTSTEESFPGFRKFDFFQIVEATDSFSNKRILGMGGFGTVYKGHLPDGHTVAIKRLDDPATISDFNSELQLARLHHTSIIRLLGWCIHEKERLLVYEFMQNDSLQNAIFEKTKGAMLNWSKRLQIIKGLAEGLVYLHKHARIVHRDLKPHNILLDNGMNPKIADFGSAITLASDLTEERTSRVVGTSGYIAPEYASGGLYSRRTDVFSFGILVLVIISGRKNTIMEQQGDTVGNLVRYAWDMWKNGRFEELVDPALCDGYQTAVIRRCTQVALLCAKEDPANRPTMTDVATMLNSESILLPDPKGPTELINGGASRDTSSTYIGQSSKTIDITITTSAPVTRVRIIVEPDI